jgi:hypothetical protein
MKENMEQNIEQLQDSYLQCVKELERNKKIIEDFTKKIDQRIVELNQADADLCQDRWDMTKPEMERKIYREFSNQVTATRQELERLKRMLSLPDITKEEKDALRIPENEDVRATARKTFDEHMQYLGHTPLVWHVYKRAFDIASFSLPKPKKEQKEFIICAAVLINGKTIVCGRRHGDCYETVKNLKPLYVSGPNDDISVEQTGDDRANQGFMTSHGRFVYRPEAFIIAKDNNQIIHKMFDDDKEGILTSEDLY